MQSSGGGRKFSSLCAVLFRQRNGSDGIDDRWSEQEKKKREHATGMQRFQSGAEGGKFNRPEKKLDN